MVLLEIYLDRIWCLPFKRDAPWAVDMNALADGPGVQRMQIVAGKIHIPQVTGCVQELESVIASLDQFGIHLGAPSGLEYLLEALVPEARDHLSNVACRASHCQLLHYTSTIGGFTTSLKCG